MAFGLAGPASAGLMVTVAPASVTVSHPHDGAVAAWAATTVSTTEWAASAT